MKLWKYLLSVVYVDEMHSFMVNTICYNRLKSYL